MISKTVEEIYWIAGLLEGEGCFYSNSPYSCAITIQITDKDVIYKIASILGGTGNVREPDISKSTGFNKKQVYSYSIFGILAVDWMRLILPIMGERRKTKILELLSNFDNRPITGDLRIICRKGHDITNEENYYVDKNKVKQCRICKKETGSKNYRLNNSMEARWAKLKGISVEQAKEELEKIVGDNNAH